MIMSSTIEINGTRVEEENGVIKINGVLIDNGRVTDAKAHFIAGVIIGSIMSGFLSLVIIKHLLCA